MWPCFYQHDLGVDTIQICKWNSQTLHGSLSSLHGTADFKGLLPGSTCSLPLAPGVLMCPERNNVFMGKNGIFA